MPTPNGPHNQPRFDLNDDGDFAADLTTVSEFAAAVGNVKSGSTTARNAATSLDVWEGLLWQDTTDGNTYRYSSNAWTLYAMSAPKYKQNAMYMSTTTANFGTSGYAYCMYTAAAGFCHVQYNIYWGASSTPGVGNYGLNLPIPAVIQGGRIMLAGNYQRNGTSGASGFTIFAFSDTTDLSRLNILQNDGGTRIASTISNTGVFGDRLLIAGSYPIAPMTLVS